MIEDQDPELQHAAAEGAELMDAEYNNWWRHINVSKLDISNGCNCIIGQLYGRYVLGIDYLFRAYEEEYDDQDRFIFENGFDTTHSYTLLEKYWKEEIAYRKEKDNVV